MVVWLYPSLLLCAKICISCYVQQRVKWGLPFAFKSCQLSYPGSSGGGVLAWVRVPLRAFLALGVIDVCFALHTIHGTLKSYVLVILLAIYLVCSFFDGVRNSEFQSTSDPLCGQDLLLQQLSYLQCNIQYIAVWKHHPGLLLHAK